MGTAFAYTILKFAPGAIPLKYPPPTWGVQVGCRHELGGWDAWIDHKPDVICEYQNPHLLINTTTLVIAAHVIN